MKIFEQNIHIDNRYIRFTVLVVGAVIGALFHRFSLPFVYGLLGVPVETGDHGNIYIDGNIYINSVVLGLPVVVCLWWFRTRDTRQDINQAKLFNALQLLSSDTPVQIDIGTHQLLRLSETVPEFDKDIQLAFARRLQVCPLDKDQIAQDHERLTYAQHIVHWFIENDDFPKLPRAKFDCQDFTYQGEFYEFLDSYYDARNSEQGNSPDYWHTEHWTKVNLHLTKCDRQKFNKSLENENETTFWLVKREFAESKYYPGLD